MKNRKLVIQIKLVNILSKMKRKEKKFEIVNDKGRATFQTHEHCGEQPFENICVDADTPGYYEYVIFTIESNLVDRGDLIVVNNVSFMGSIP